MNKNAVEEIKGLYKQVRPEIKERLKVFSSFLQDAGREDVFKELCFCLFTPQSKAESCWKAVEDLSSSGLLWDGNQDAIADRIKGVRFRFNKARYLILARDMFLGPGSDWRMYMEGDAPVLRDLLVREIKGLGMKEASHFLRNIGIGFNLAILDRHILKNLAFCGVIKEVPSSLSKKRYIEIEAKMARFSYDIDIPMPELDLLFWYKQAGKVFK